MATPRIAVPPMPRTKATVRTRVTGCRGKSVSILSISPSPGDHAALRRILRGRAWHIETARGCVDAIACLTSTRVSIIVCESCLPGGSWQDILRHADQYAEFPILIVTSRVADDYLWAEVLNLGGYDVLAKPFDQAEVRRVIENARLRKANVAAVAGHVTYQQPAIRE